MMKRWAWCLLAWLTAGPALAQAQVDLSTLGKNDAGPPTQVLVMGMVHLAEAPKSFTPGSLQPVLDRLVAFKPGIITVEEISGEGCDLVARYPTVYAPDDMRPYCRDTAMAKAATGLDVPAAIAEVQRSLKHWPAKPAFSQRRHLAALFLAANDDTSALVQWLQLPAAERHAGEGLDDGLAAQLDGFMLRNDESHLIAARLAARLGLQRVFAVDDHTGDNVDVEDARAFGAAIQHAWDGAAAEIAPIRKQQAALWQSGDMLALYRYVNSPQVLRMAVRSDFGAALGDTSPEHYGEIYVAGWETRNLRMVANVRAAFRESPGIRVLAIVGSSHKPWFDSLLGQMQGVQIVDAEQVLK